MTTIIKDPGKPWWNGDDRVEKLMPPVAEAIRRHVKWPSDEFTDIYNRAYEAVYAALQTSSTESQPTPRAVDGSVVCRYCQSSANLSVVCEKCLS